MVCQDCVEKVVDVYDYFYFTLLSLFFFPSPFIFSLSDSDPLSNIGYAHLNSMCINYVLSVCVCPPAGYQEDPCFNQPCGRRGECFATQDGYVCNCYTRYEGESCQNDTGKVQNINTHLSIYMFLSLILTNNTVEAVSPYENSLQWVDQSRNVSSFHDGPHLGFI